MYICCEINKKIHIQDVIDLETKIKGSSPKGYREFITKFGPGELNSFIFLMSPLQIESTANEWQDILLNKSYTNPMFPLKLRKEAFVFAYSIDFDIFAFHPKKNQIYCLSGHSEEIFCTGESVFEMIDWSLFSGAFYPRHTQSYFQPECRRMHRLYSVSNPPDMINFEQALASLGQEDCKIIEFYSIHIFYFKWGAKITYSIKHSELSLSFDKEYALLLSPILDDLLSKMLFTQTEEYFSEV